MSIADELREWCLGQQHTIAITDPFERGRDSGILEISGKWPFKIQASLDEKDEEIAKLKGYLDIQSDHNCHISYINKKHRNHIAELEDDILDLNTQLGEME